MISSYLLFGRFVLGAISRKYTDYYVTTKRAFISNGLGRWGNKSIDLTSDQEVYMIGKNRGSIKIGSAKEFDLVGVFWIWQGDNHPFCFERIKNGPEVLALIKSIQKQNGPRG